MRETQFWVDAGLEGIPEACHLLSATCVTALSGTLSRSVVAAGLLLPSHRQ